MSSIIEYTSDQARGFMGKVCEAYKNIQKQALDFEDWKCLAYTKLYEQPEKFDVIPYKYGTKIRVAKTAVEMMEIIQQHKDEVQDIELNAPPVQQDYLKTELFKKILEPAYEFTLDKPLTISGKCEGKDWDVPIWFNTTLNSVNVRLGFANCDKSTPGAIPLSDGPVHMLLGGITGAGKSVALNDIICSLLLEYAPWELSLILADFKIVELSRYANRIPTPHVKIVAATSSTEFALSTFDYMIKEMDARKDLFTACGIQNIKDFRKKFDLCMPRMLLIADEFVQMYQNIKTAEENGDENASETKSKINNAISAIARLGRSQGIHMLLSSQDMDGILDEQTAGQFSAGATLRATPSVSKTLIGNDAGATLTGKGKAYINLNKTLHDPSTNVLTWVPYINSEISEEEASQGKLSYLQELLSQMYNAAQTVNYESVPYYYNENETLPRKYLYDSLVECKEYMLNPDEGDDISNQFYKKMTFARIPLGREIKYTKESSATISLRFKACDNLLINADDELTKYYICKLVGEMLSHFATKYVVISANEVLTAQVNLQSFCDAQGVSYEIDQTGSIPSRYITMVTTRRTLLDIQNYLVSKGIEKGWDTCTVLEFVYNRISNKQKPQLSKLIEYAKSADYDILRDSCEEDIRNAFPDLDESSRQVYVNTIAETARYRKSLQKLTNNFQETLCAGSFDRVVIWWMGVDEIKGLSDYDTKALIKDYLSNCCQTGIFNILVPSRSCSKITDYAELCNFILERCSKQFFMDINLRPFSININKNSYQVYDRELNQHKIARFYS